MGVGPNYVLGFLMTKITESPLKNILLMYLSRLMGFARFPLFFLGISLQISQAFSKTMFKWRSNAFNRANILRLFRQLTRIWEFVFTALVNIARGPSFIVSSYGVCLSSASGFLTPFFYESIFKYLFSKKL